ncbi:MAG: sn-glycerol-3-phosphate ABC transporter ATP-binding protein UgpC [Candidatus Hydrogenedentota bacterium]
MSTVRLNNVWKIYEGNVEAVKDANINVEDKEFVILVGPSGCGKSTTLRMVAGLEDITKGEIYIDDKIVNDVPPKDRDIAMVFQNYALYPHMSVYDNMAFGLKLRKFPKDEIDRRVKEAAETLGLSELLDRKPKALSGGQRQRVAVGRAIVRKPKVFLFDEPLSNLDAKLRVQMRAELSKLHTRLQATMIYVTHDQIEAMTMGTKIVVMKDGIIQQTDAPIDLYKNPVNKFVAGFIGTPPMNFITTTVEEESGNVYLNEGTFRVRVLPEMANKLRELNLKSRQVTLGIRPENIFDKVFMPDAPPEHTVRATVEIVEPMGAEVYLHLTTGKHMLTARVSGDDQAEVNDQIDLVFDMSKAQIFSIEDDRKIACLPA